MNTIYIDKFVEIRFDEGLSFLEYEWSENENYTPDKAYSSFLKIIDLLQEYKPELILNNAQNSHTIISVEVQREISETTLKTAEKVNSKKIAVVYPKELFANMSSEQTIEEVKDLIAVSRVQVSTFNSREKALEWLKS